GELPRDRETEPGAATVPRPEWPEDAIALRLFDPRPRVGHGDGYRSVLRRQGKFDPPALRRPAEGVREQVHDDLQHAVAVGHDHGLRTQVESIVDLSPPSLLSERRIRALREPLHVDLFL